MYKSFWLRIKNRNLGYRTRCSDGSAGWGSSEYVLTLPGEKQKYNSSDGSDNYNVSVNLMYIGKQRNITAGVAILNDKFSFLIF
jgi:hypothetical protein